MVTTDLLSVVGNLKALQDFEPRFALFSNLGDTFRLLHRIPKRGVQIFIVLITTIILTCYKARKIVAALKGLGRRLSQVFAHLLQQQQQP